MAILDFTVFIFLNFHKNSMDDVINYQYHIKFTCYVLSRGYLLEQMILLKYLFMCSMLRHASKKQQFYQKMSVAIYVIFKHDKIDINC